MISPQQDDFFGILHLIAEQKLNRLHGVVTSVHEIPNEYVTTPRQLSSHLEQFKHVKKLSMNIAANDHRSLSLVHVALFKEELFDLVAKSADSLFLQVLAGLELSNPLIDFSHLNFIMLQLKV